MKTTTMSLAILCTAAGMVFGVAQGPQYPFPQNVKYPYGFSQDIIDSDHVQAWYESMKTKYLQTCSNNSIRPGVSPLSKSLVEAQGFIMIAAAYMGDKETFDKLYTYYKSRCSNEGCGFMGWKQIGCDTHEDRGSASDGDIDVACGLVVANWQWPDQGYESKATELINNLERIIVSCSNGVQAICGGCSNGNAWGGCNETDISYYEPAFFREFAKLSGNDMWDKLADDTHKIRDAAANQTTGLVPDWQSVSGTAGAGSRVGYYGFDAIRAPYKQALDYLWNGNEEALAWCKKITTWAHGYGVDKLKDGFQLNGTIQGSNHNLAIVGSLAVAAMANSQDILDDFARESKKLNDDFWYSGYLGNLYLLALSGNMWTPEIVEANQVNAKGKNMSHSLTDKDVHITTIARRAITIRSLNAGTTVSLTTLDGQQIVSMTTTVEKSASINIAQLRRGCYLLNVTDRQGKRQTRKVIALL